MPFTLAMYLYQKVQQNFQNEFEKHNTIVSLESINSLGHDGDERRMTEIFKSAIVDHAPVDGRPYYLCPPVTPVFYHDLFKRCLIAKRLGCLAATADKRVADNAKLTLRTMVQDDAYGYVNIFAWHALAAWAKMDKEIIEEVMPQIELSFGSAPAVFLGLIVFLEETMTVYGKDKVYEIITEHQHRVCYRMQKVMLSYFNCKHQLGLSCERFADECAQRFASQKVCTLDQINAGLHEIGLIPGDFRKGVWKSTQQAEIAGYVRKMTQDYLPLIGYYRLSDY